MNCGYYLHMHLKRYLSFFSVGIVLTSVLWRSDLLRAANSPADVKPVHLRCESLENPLGIDTLRPQFSWQMQDGRRGARQTAYQILVSRTAENLSTGQGILWDSGKVASANSLNIDYGGASLASGERYYWAVRIWDASSAPSQLSDAAWWETGLLTQSDWKARWISRSDPELAADRKAGVKWIWFPGEKAGQQPPPITRFFRYTLNLASLPSEATFLVAGKDSMEAFINNTKVGSSSTWGTFEVIDIRKQLKTGENLISVAVKMDGPANLIVPSAGLAALLKIKHADGTVQRIPTDARWKASTNSDSGFVPAIVTAELAAKPLADPWPPAPASYFRKAFAAKQRVERARLYVTALGSYRAFLNGARVGEDILTPGWTDYSKHVQYQTYDVTRLLKKGENVVAAVVGDGWYGSGLGWKLQRYLFGPPPSRLLLQLELTFSDGTKQTVVTDNTWRASLGAIRSSEIYAGETYDARLAVPFSTVSFRDTTWPQAQMEPAPQGSLVAQRDPAIRESETVQPKQVTSPAPGVYVYDLGQNISGWVRLQVHGPEGTAVRLRFAEILKPDGNIYRDNLRSAAATDTYILRGKGKEEYQPSFTYHGFRYVEVSGYPGKPPDDAITGIAIHTALPETGSFETSSELVNQLWRNILWGQRDNLVSIPTDCPQRDERLGWMADAQIFWRTASFNMNMASFTNKWMMDVRDAQSPNGAFSDVSPRVVDMADGAPAWGDAGIIVPWNTWQQFGDLRIVSENWDAMKAWLTYVRQGNPDFTWENHRNNDFGDWVPANSTTPKDLLATAFWAYDAELMSQMAEALGKHSEAAEYKDLYGKIKTAFVQKFVKDDDTVGNGSQTSYVLALYMGLLPNHLRAPAADHLAHDIESRDWHLSTGFAGTSLLMPALSGNGKNDVAYRLLLNDTYPSWGYMIRKGATTMWERWNGDTGDPAMNSYNHYAFGAVGEWLYRTVGGINPDPALPGFKKIIIHPRPDSRLSHSFASYDSPYGKISTDWTMRPGEPFTLKVTIPANTSARVYLPAKPGGQITEGGNPLGKDIAKVGHDGDFLVYRLGAGSYDFVVQ